MNLSPDLALRPSRRTLLAGLVGAGALSSGVALTATSGWLIVRASEGPQILLLLTAIVAVRAFGIARPALRYAERLVSHDDALGHLAAVRAQTYAALLPLTPARLGTRSRADLLSGVVDDLTEVAEARVRVVVPVVATGVTGLLAAALLALADGRVALLVLLYAVLVGVVAVASWWLESSSQAGLLAARARTQEVADLVTRQGDALAAIGAGDDARAWLDEAHQALATATRRQSRGRALVAGAVIALGASTSAAAVVVARGSHDGPALALLVLTPIALIEAFAGVSDATRALARAQAARRRIADLLDQSPAVVSHAPVGWAPSTTPTLELRGVTATWTGAPALRRTDLTLEPGSRTVVVGANGCGKSTLLAVLARHLDPAAGRYLVDGVDVTGLGLDQVRDLVAVLDDEPHVFAGSLADNLRLARPDATDADLRAALREAHLTGVGDLDTRLGEGGRGLSGGERARLGLARVLLSGRPIVLLDEPVAHLDHATAVGVLTDLLAATRGRTVVMVSHRADLPVPVDRIVDLSHSARLEEPSHAVATR